MLLFSNYSGNPYGQTNDTTKTMLCQTFFEDYGCDGNKVKRANHDAMDEYNVGYGSATFGIHKDLRGCINDLKSVRKVLMYYLGFEAEDIQVVTDERATKENIVRRLWGETGKRYGMGRFSPRTRQRTFRRPCRNALPPFVSAFS